jgi:hypothetical protein
VVKRTPWYSYGIEVLVPHNPKAKAHRGRKIVTWPTGQFTKGGWSQIVPGVCLLDQILNTRRFNHVVQGVPVDCDSVSRRPYYREYSTPNPQLDNFSEDIWCYTLKGVPQWMRFKPGMMLRSLDTQIDAECIV